MKSPLESALAQVGSYADLLQFDKLRAHLPPEQIAKALTNHDDTSERKRRLPRERVVLLLGVWLLYVRGEPQGAQGVEGGRPLPIPRARGWLGADFSRGVRPLVPSPPVPLQNSRFFGSPALGNGCLGTPRQRAYEAA